MSVALEHWVDQNNLIDQMACYVSVNDMQSKFIFSNKAAAYSMGFATQSEAYGKYYYDIKCQASQKADMFFLQDHLVFNKKKKVSSVCYLNYLDREWMVLYCTKSPIFDKNQNLLGLISMWHDITDLRLIDISRFLIQENDILKKKQFCYIIDEKKNILPQISSKEKECLFFLIRGKTAKIIAKNLNLSHRTVEGYIDRIKQKLNCSNKVEIIDKAISMGWMNFIPSSLWYR